MPTISQLIRKGREKAVAERVCYSAMDLVQQRTNDDPLKTFKKALDNVKPVLEVKSRRVGGATYQVPVEVRQERRVALAMRWLIEYAKDRGAAGLLPTPCRARRADRRTASPRR